MKSVRSIAVFCILALLVACNGAQSNSPLPASNPASHGDSKAASHAGAHASHPDVVRAGDTIGTYGPQTFSFSGKPQTYTVPAGAKTATITAWGAGVNNQIYGGLTVATVPVAPAEQLSVIVGGEGKTSNANTGGVGGYGGSAPGGNGGNSTCCKNSPSRGPGGGGAGATYVAHANGSLAVVAGGAGGFSGSFNDGGVGGGAKGGNANSPYDAGKGGDQSCSGNPTSGNQGQSSVLGGGGGGGGYCGGGGGSGSRSTSGSDVGDSGGGGGSGFFEKGATGNPTTTAGKGLGEDGQILIVPPPKIFNLGGPSSPQHVAVDKKGNVYVSDPNATSIKKIAPDGTVTSLGSGLNNPEGVGVDASGNVYVADYGNEAVKRISPSGTVTTIDGGYLKPMGLALDFNGHVYITAVSKGAFGIPYWALRRINLSTNYDSIVYWEHTTTSSGEELAVDPYCVPTTNGCTVYVTVQPVSSNYEIYAVKYDGTVASKTKLATLGVDPNGGIAVNSGTLYVVSTGVNRVEQYQGNTHTALGSGWQSPIGIAIAPGCKQLCNVYVGDAGNNTTKAWVP
jgi:Glycine rich protein/NHL repeat